MDPYIFVRGGPTLIRLGFFVCFFRGARLQKPTKAGNYQPASETPLKWCLAGGPIMAHIECWLGSFVILQGIQTSITRKPYKFVIFQGGSGLSLGTKKACRISLSPGPLFDIKYRLKSFQKSSFFWSNLFFPLRVVPHYEKRVL